MVDEREVSVMPAPLKDGMSSAVVEHLRNAVRQALKESETVEIVELLCDNNGWTVEDFKQRPHEFLTLELFLVAVPQLPQLRLFPYLTVVKIVHAGLESMEGLSYLHHVEELWLNENNITSIKGLENMSRLKKLYLQGNMIKSMDGFPCLPQLRRLWLCGNQLVRIISLQKFPKLKSLWVASNRITSLDNAFTSSMTSLEELNLANNQIYFFGQLDHLSVLASLRSLWLSDSMYGDAPMCHLSNYTTFSLQRLPQLEELDGGPITQEQRSLAISVYAKKRIYYSMRGAILDRNIAILTRFVRKEAEEKQNLARDALRQLSLEIVRLCHSSKSNSGTSNGSSMSSNSSNLTIPDDMKTHVTKLQRAMETREVELESIEKEILAAQHRSFFEKDTLHERLSMELHSCGNIRLEEGTDEDSWCNNAKELLSSRFDASLYAHLGVTGVKANRVFRITCQGLRERFDGRMRELDIDLADTRARRALVRLFTSLPKRPEEQRSFLNAVMTSGFTSLYGEDEGIPLTNSLFYADEERLGANSNIRDNIYGLTLQPDSLSGQIIVSRLFLGKCVAEMGGRRESSSNEEPRAFMRSDRRTVTRAQYGSEVFSIYRSSPHDASVKVWHMFDKYLVLPEYVIDFTYTIKAHLSVAPALSIYDSGSVLQDLIDKVASQGAQEDISDIRTVGYPLLSFLHWLNTSAFRTYATEETKNVVQRAKELHPSKTTFTASGLLSDELLSTYRRHIHSPPGVNMQFCDLSEQRITGLPREFNTSLWASLKILLLQNNSISVIAWAALALAAPSLEELDLSGNSLADGELSADGAATFLELRVLRLSHNKLHALADLASMTTAAPVLEEFHMDHNPWMQTRAAEAYCLSVIPSLKSLNGIHLARHAGLSMLRKRTLSLEHDSLQYIIEEYRRCIESQSNNSSSSCIDDADDENARIHHGGAQSTVDVMVSRCYEKIFVKLSEMSETERSGLLIKRDGYPSTFLRGVHVFSYCRSLTRCVQWTSWMPHLRQLSLVSHVIEDISPIAELRHLRSLDLSDNVITTAEPLADLKRLASLNLSQNRLRSTQGLEKIVTLRFLSICQNAINDMTSLHQCTSLEEFYFADNDVAEVRDLYLLHRLPNLVSMDALGNPCAMQSTLEGRNEYRYYLVYNLPKLKVLDGVPISDSEQQCARDVFSGRVNSELLEERIGLSPNHWGSVEEVDLSHCGLREVMLLQPFSRLRVLHLHHNNMIRVDGLLPLTKLVALNLSHNRLGQCRLGDTLGQLVHLQSLSLESNHITDVSSLALTLPHLKFLNLKGNEITSLDQGLQHLPDLRELLLDNNKLRALGQDCFSNNLHLTDISADENFIRSTEGLQPLMRLERLSLGSNRLADLRALLNDLRGCNALSNATFLGNSIARKTPYRAQTIATLSSLTLLDNKEVSDDERERAEAVRTIEFTAPPNVVLEPNFPMEVVLNGMVRVSGAAGGALRAPTHQPPRFPVTGNGRLQLPSYKNARADVSKGLVPRMIGGSR